MILTDVCSLTKNICDTKIDDTQTNTYSYCYSVILNDLKDANKITTMMNKHYRLTGGPTERNNATKL